MHPRLAEFWARISTSLWFISGLITLGAILAAWAALQVRLDVENVWWLHSGSGRDASELLASQLSSLINMTTLTISITMVVLTLAAQQLGPRLIRSFMGDWRTQGAIGLFTGTTVYILLVLRGLDGNAPAEQVPHFAVTGATVLIVLCIFALLLHVHHLARSVIADTVINRVGRLFDETIVDSHPKTRSPDNKADAEPATPPAIYSFARSGYVQAMDFEGLAQAARHHGARIALTFRPGHHLLRNGRHVRVWPAAALNADLKRAIARAVVLGDDRTSTQDMEFAVRQLVEVAMRALSPSINDPFTAIAVIDRLAASFELYFERAEAQQAWADEHGHTCLTAPTSDFGGIAAVAFNPIRQAAVRLPSVLIHLLETIGQLSERASTDEQKRALATHATMIANAGLRSFAEPRDQSDLMERFSAVQSRLGKELVKAPTSTGGSRNRRPSNSSSTR